MLWLPVKALKFGFRSVFGTEAYRDDLASRVNDAIDEYIMDYLL
jgi:hypothetical protein